MCHLSNPQQIAATKPSPRILQEAAQFQDARCQGDVNATCDRPLPAPRKFIRQAVVKNGMSSSAQQATDANNDIKIIAACKAALGRSIASDEPAQWERDSAIKACQGLSLILL
jgi:hypothetical protein